MTAWPNIMTNLNGKVYILNEFEWLEKKKTSQHFSILRLIEKFRDIDDNEGIFIFEKFAAENKREIEPINTNIMNRMN